jgi:ADP-ribosylglycohydrolase/protein-tyrosine phosphatase
LTLAKTSRSHPLQVDNLAVEGLSGVIGLTFCPGKKQPGALSGDWNRDLAADLEAIKSSGAKALVTLMENDELTAVRVPLTELGKKAASMGLEWHHLPIRDVDVPDGGFEDRWIYSGFRLRHLLLHGKKVVIHCLGGLGRTGTVAGRILVEFGASPNDAIRAVRAARIGTIETRKQEEYVKNCKPLASAGTSRSHEEKALAVLLGGAIGDAFGYEVEFDSIGKIRKRFGSLGITEPILHDRKLIVSDDTQMTLFTLEGMLRTLANDKFSVQPYVDSIRLAYLDWLETQRGGVKGKGWLAAQPDMHARRAPGNTCMSALGAGGRGSISHPINDSKGCGGVMRVAPIGLISKGFKPEQAFQLAAEAAACTHGHPSGYLSAGAMATMVRFLAEGADLRSATDQSLAILLSYEGHKETEEAVKAAVALAGQPCRDRAAAVETLGGGWVGEEALAIGLYAALCAGSFVEAIRIATNHSGDSDSTASIAGQLWGAMHGLDGIPHVWVSSLGVLLPLLHLARQLPHDLFAPSR